MSTTLDHSRNGEFRFSPFLTAGPFITAALWGFGLMFVALIVNSYLQTHGQPHFAFLANEGFDPLLQGGLNVASLAKFELVWGTALTAVFATFALIKGVAVQLGITPITRLWTMGFAERDAYHYRIIRAFFGSIAFVVFNHLAKSVEFLSPLQVWFPYGHTGANWAGFAFQMLTAAMPIFGFLLAAIVSHSMIFTPSGGRSLMARGFNGLVMAIWGVAFGVDGFALASPMLAGFTVFGGLAAIGVNILAMRAVVSWVDRFILHIVGPYKPKPWEIVASPVPQTSLEGDSP